MKRIHLIFGLFVLIVFLLTGQYMDRHYNHLAGMPDAPRLLYRTRHIFILLSGLINVGLGAYLNVRQDCWRKILQRLGSSLILVAPLLFLAGFIYEPRWSGLHTPLSHWGTYTITAGTFCHWLSGARHSEAQ